MTQKRKAELQRKLSIAPVPRPPDGLADRIKAQIPDLQSTQKDRERLSRSVAFNLRVAASILLLISSAFVAIRFLSPAQKSAASLEQAPPASAIVTVTIEPAAKVKAAEQPVATDAVSASTANGARLSSTASLETANVMERKKERDEGTLTRAERRDRESEASGVGGAVVGGVVAALPPPPPPAAPAPTPAPPREVAAVAEPVPQRQMAKSNDRAGIVAAAPVAPAQPPAVSESVNVTADSPAFVMTARAADLKLGAPSSLFGASLKRNEFERVRSLIESKQQPDPASVDVAALINHFAGTQASRAPVAMQVEASQAPLPDASGILRITIDTPAAPENAASLPPVASNATLNIDVNTNVVDHYEIVGGGQLESKEQVLVKGSSVTRLVELKLNPDTRPDARVATVTLKYTSVTNGKPQELHKTITARDLRRNWTASSRRHRLATLGAVWIQSLGGSEESGNDVARTAERLSSEKPDDERAKELARAASASSRLRSSSPTGSGR